MDINRGSESAAWFLVPWSHLSDTFQPQHHSLKFDPSLVINDFHMTCLRHSFSWKLAFFPLSFFFFLLLREVIILLTGNRWIKSEILELPLWLAVHFKAVPEHFSKTVFGMDERTLGNKTSMEIASKRQRHSLHKRWWLPDCCYSFHQSPLLHLTLWLHFYSS